MTDWTAGFRCRSRRETGDVGIKTDGRTGVGAQSMSESEDGRPLLGVLNDVTPFEMTSRRLKQVIFVAVAVAYSLHWKDICD